MSDSPSVKVLQALKAVFPNLCGMALDPVRLAIVYEYAQWRKRTPSSKLLRDLLHNVVQHDSEKGMLSWGSIYDGRESDPLSRQEETWSNQILSGTHTQAYAQRMINNLDLNSPA
jgi:hypothetical protein